MANYYPSKINNIDIYLINEMGASNQNNFITNKFPFSNNVYHQFLGNSKRTYNLSIVLHSPIIDELDAINKRNVLVSEFQKNNGFGSLIHPTDGVINGIFASWTENINYNKTGIIILQLNFLEGDLQQFPTKSDINSEKIINKNIEIKALSNTNIKKNLKDVSKKANLFNALKDKTNKLLTTMESKLNSIKGLQSNINDAKDFILSTRARLLDIIQYPELFANTLTNFFDTMKIIAEDDKTNIEVMQSLYNFGKDDLIPQFNTSQNQEVQYNNKVVNFNNNVMALSNTYEQFTTNEWKNTDELNYYVQILETQYNYINNNFSNYDIEILESLKAMREETLLYANNISNTLPKIELINWEGNPLILLCYNLYNSLDYYDDLNKLNNFIDNRFCSKETKILRFI